MRPDPRLVRRHVAPVFGATVNAADKALRDCIRAELVDAGMTVTQGPASSARPPICVWTGTARFRLDAASVSAAHSLRNRIAQDRRCASWVEDAVEHMFMVEHPGVLVREVACALTVTTDRDVVTIDVDIEARADR